GHTLVIPKQEVDYIFDLDDETYTGLMAFARRVARALEGAVECKRVGVAVMGLEVPHAHVHLIPITTEGDMNFFREKLALPAEEMAAIAARIAEKM
ncbi:MAG: HIT family protein, partial [Bacteroidales bacterium]|nr:HIT family protein [Bacteroidales bacterium]